MRKGIILFLVVFGVVLIPQTGFGCEICTIPRLGRQEKFLTEKDEKKKWLFEFLYEQQNWNDIPALEAHLLHEDGRDIHNKTTEHFYHFTLGRNLGDDLSVSFEIPFVVRNSKNVADGKIGLDDKSEGIGDLTSVLSYRVLGDENWVVRGVGGAKFPTGITSNRDIKGDKFEPELQPGSGSFDYFLGALAEIHRKQFAVKGNAVYTFKTRGGQNFEFGDVFSTSLFFDYLLNPESKSLKTTLGIDVNYQFAQKNRKNGIKERDSGGNSLFVGPTITIDGPLNTAVFANFLYPVYQDYGGVHQEMNFVWTAGGQIKW